MMIPLAKKKLPVIRLRNSKPETVKQEQTNTESFEQFNYIFMKAFNTAFINGELVTPHGTTVVDLINPTNNEVIVKVTMCDEGDTRNTIEAANQVIKTWSRTSKEERLGYLLRIYD